jgi:hypothetical protein
MAWIRWWFALSSRGWVLVGLAIVNIVLVVLFGARSKLYAPPDAIPLQLAFWPSVFASIVVDQWGADKAHLFVATLWRLDFLFPLAYASFLRGLYVWLSGKLGAPVSWLLALLPWIAAGLDVVENLLQVHLIGQALAGGTAAGSFRLGVLAMSLCAAAKWSLLVVSLLGTVAVLLRSEVAWAVWTCRFGLLSMLLGSAPLILSAQGQDLLRVVADDALSNLQTLVTYGALLLWATSVWYWSRVLLQIRWQAGEPGGAGEQSTAGSRIASWLPRTLGTATLLLASVACFEAASGVAEPLHGRLLWHAGYCLALGLAFFYFVKLRRRLFGWPPEPLRVDSWPQLPRATRAIAWTSLAVSALVLISFVSAPVSVGWRLGTPAILFLAAANAVFFGSGTVLVSRAYRFPFVVFALAAAAVFSGWNDNHAVRLLEIDTATPRPELRAAFEHWARPRLDEWQKQQTGRMPVFLVAAEGGGIRAAYWAAVVLGRLQDRHPAFARQVFGISGVSGGSLGASVFVALLHDGAPEASCRGYAGRESHSADLAQLGPMETCAQEVLRQDLLAPAVGKLVGPDFLQWFVPVPVPAFDRALAIEDSFSAAYERATGRNTLDQAFLSVSRCQGQDCRAEDPLPYPALLLNGAHVHTGQRLLRAPFTWPNSFAEDPADDRMPQITDLTTLLQADVRLATAAHDSARFAYVSPAGRLLSARGRDFGHVVDGGYFENSGAATLRDVLDVLEDSVVKEHVEFVVVYLCNNPDRCYGATVGSDPARAASQAPGLGEVFSPVRTLLGAREARGSLAIAHLKQRLGRRFFEFGLCPADQEPPVPLGWQLSEGMRARLSEQARGSGAPGNLDSDACVEATLDGNPADATCRPPFTPAVGCRDSAASR